MDERTQENEGEIENEEAEDVCRMFEREKGCMYKYDSTSGSDQCAFTDSISSRDGFL